MSLSGHDTPSATLPPLDGDTANGAPPPTSARWRRSGDTVSRYMVVDIVGAGGMGVVYAAYDPELDRKVALKLLRADATRNRAQARRRFVREAKAMAQLAHPNVITVHDAGTADDEAFLTMEFVDGQTLAEWLEGQPRSWANVVDVFLQAGRGLAAAHDANIVHRDFKPENVLIRRDGRVLVTDFGLARAADISADSLAEDDPHEAPGSANDLAIPLTRTGAILGTPAYMAPEQRFGLSAGAAADQFSFCVAMYEALYGHRPFAGITVHEIFEAIERQEIRDPAPGTRVPGRLRRVLLRGLRAKPEERYPSMHELLAELEPPRRTGARIAGLALVAGVLGAGAVTLAGGEDENQCAGVDGELDDVWNETTSGEVEAALLAAQSIEARDTWSRSRTIFDRYTHEWLEMRRATCVAFNVEHSLGEATYDWVNLCLDERRQELSAAIDVLGSLEPEELPRVLNAIGIINPVARCDAEHMGAAPPVGDGEAYLAQREAMLEAGALWELGRRKEALDSARRAGEQIDSPAASLYADLTLARMLIEVADPEGPVLMEDVFHRGIVRGDFGVVGPAAVNWMYALSRDPSRLREAEIIGATALSVTRSAQPGGVVEAGIRLGLARLYVQQGRPQDAIEELRPLYESLDPERDPFDLLNITMQLGVAHHKLGQNERASQLLLESLRLVEQLHGPKSRQAVVRLTNLAEVESSRGRLVESLQYAERATDAALHLGDGGLHVLADALLRTGASHLTLGDRQKALQLIRWGLGLRVHLTGPESIPSAEAAGLHAVVLAEQGEREAALRELERVLVIQRRLLLPGDRALTITLNNAGSEAMETGDLDKARRYHGEALEMRLEHDAPPADVAISINNLADVDLAEGKLEDAIAGYEAALARWSQSSAAGSTYPSWSWHGMGVAKAGAGDLDGAREALERALELREGGVVASAQLGRTRWQLAKVEAAAGNSSRAKALAELARNDLEGEDEAEQIAAWIAAGLPPP